MDKPKQTLVEEGTELKGTLKSRCQVVVNGSIDGQIEAPALRITQTGSVFGTVRAQTLRSEGTLAGDIDADDVYLSGTVRSNTMIRAKTLEVKLTPEKGKLEVTFGECLLEVGDDPAKVEVAGEKPTTTAAVEAIGTPTVEATGTPPAQEAEPRWSDTPLADSEDLGTSGEADAAADDLASEAEGAPNGQSKKKRGKNRESQIPPA